MTALIRFDEEQHVLSAAMATVPSWTRVMESLTARDFSDERHQTIFAALATVTPTGRSVDLLPVLQRVRETGDEAMRDYANSLIDVAPTTDPLPNWIAALVDASARRRTAAALTTAANALDSEQSREAVELTLDRSLMAIHASLPDGRVFDDKALMAQQVLDYLDNDDRTGTPYGFHPWDTAVLPAMPSHLILLGGASGSGKSTVARNLIRQWVQRSEVTVGWLTCEMSGEEQLTHLACLDSGVTVEEYYRKRMTDGQRRDFTHALQYWRDSDRLRINEMGGVTPDRALRIFRRWREQGVTHFLGDHLHRLDYGASRSGDDLRVPVAACAKSQKNFAKDYEATVSWLVQYTKIKPNAEPDDDNIREANNVLEEADAVFHIYRPLVGHERMADGSLLAMTKADGGRYFEHDAPKGAVLAPDQEAVYLKLGKQRRRLRTGLVRIPFNHRLALMYDSPRTLTINRDAA